MAKHGFDVLGNFWSEFSCGIFDVVLQANANFGRHAYELHCYGINHADIKLVHWNYINEW